MNQKAKKRIVVDARMINASGIGRYLQELLPLIINEYKETILLGDPEELKLFSWNQKQEIISCKAPIYSLREQFELPLKIPACDWFWSPHFNVPVFPIRARQRITTVHDVFHLAFPHEYTWLKRFYARILIQSAVSRSSVVLTVSEFSKSEIYKYTKTRQKIVKISNGISRLKPRVENDSDIQRTFFLFVGNVKPHKNLKSALLAFDQLAEDFPDLYFYIVGRKDSFITNDTEVDSFAQKYADRILFTGYISDEDLADLYRKALFFVFPSLYEGFGLPLLEAQQFGVPVIASDIEVLKEIGQDSVLFVDPHDPLAMSEGMRRMITDSHLRQSLIQKGYENLKRFSWEQAARQIMEQLT